VPITGPDGGFSVDLAAVRSAQQAAASASAAAKAQPRLTGATPKAIAGNPGWETSHALQACLTAWEERVAQLSAQVKKISQNLGTTAGNYEAADKQVVTYLEDSLAGLAPSSAPRPRVGHVTIPGAHFTGIYAERGPHLLPENKEISNLAKLANYLVSAGFSRQSAAGIASVVGGESTGNPEVTEIGGGGGVGLIQWTPGSTMTQDGGTFGGNFDHDMDTQSEALIRYARANQSEAIARGGVDLPTLARSTDATQAAQWWSAFEGPLVPGSDLDPGLIDSILKAMPKAGGAGSGSAG
jgi:Phage tail lysozyme/Excreted virulence factor EspC, type VII ESX diderm